MSEKEGINSYMSPLQVVVLTHWISEEREADFHEKQMRFIIEFVSPLN